VVFSVGCLFAGERRRSDVGDVAQEVAKGSAWSPTSASLYIWTNLIFAREELHDILLVEVQDDILQRTLEATYNRLLAAPPCNAQALHANN